jgi:hypothetical protein
LADERETITLDLSVSPGFGRAPSCLPVLAGRRGVIPLGIASPWVACHLSKIN